MTKSLLLNQIVTSIKRLSSVVLNSFDVFLRSMHLQLKRISDASHFKSQGSYRFNYISFNTKLRKQLTLTPDSWLLTPFLLLLLFSCSSEAKKEKPSSPESIEVRQQVMMIIADNKPIAQYIETEGIIESAKQLNIVSRESGYLTQHTLVDGTPVKEGQLLFELDSRSLDIRIKEAEIALLKAERDMQIELTMRKNSGLETSKKLIESFRLQYKVDESELRLNDLRLSAQFMKMNAPFSGILSVPITRNVGDFISTGTTLGMLIQPEQNRLKLFVLQKDAASLSLHQTVLSSDLDTLGHISAISPLIDEKTQSVTVWVNIHNKRTFMHGERLKARIITSEAKATVRVPRSSVLERDNRWVVFKNRNGQAQWVYVTPVAVNREWAVVDGKGLAPGDTIAYDRHFTLSHLQKITPIVD